MKSTKTFHIFDNRKTGFLFVSWFICHCTKSTECVYIHVAVTATPYTFCLRIVGGAQSPYVTVRPQLARTDFCSIPRAHFSTRKSPQSTRKIPSEHTNRKCFMNYVPQSATAVREREKEQKEREWHQNGNMHATMNE